MKNKPKVATLDDSVTVMCFNCVDMLKKIAQFDFVNMVQKEYRLFKDNFF